MNTKELAEKIFNTGHNDDCIFCGFKDKIATEVIDSDESPLPSNEDELTFQEIRKKASESYEQYSTFKDAMAWHTWKKAFHLGYQLKNRK